MSTQKVSRLTSNAFTQHRSEDERESSESGFEVHAQIQAPQGYADSGAQPKQQRRLNFNSSSKVARGAGKSSRRTSSPLLDEDGFELDGKERGGEVEDGRTSSNFVRPAEGRTGRATYGSEGISGNLNRRLHRPTTLKARGKPVPKTAAEWKAAASLYRANTMRGAKTFSYHKRTPAAPWRAKRNLSLAASRRRSQRLALERSFRNEMAQPRGRSRGDLSHKALAEITRGGMLPNSAR
jgi:hypothetical protein